MNDILAIILKDTYSLSQLKTRLRILKSSLLKAFFGGENLEYSQQELNWLKSLPAQFYQKFNKDNVYQILADIEKQIGNLKNLTIYLTFEPDETTLAQLGIYVRNSFGPTILLDTKVDPSLIAGTALVWKGIYRDYSLRARLEAKSGELLAEFKKFSR